MDSLGISNVEVRISQNGKRVITKEKKDCSFARDRIITHLTPDDTSKLKPFYRYAEVQAICKTNMGSVFATDIERLKVDEILR